MINPSTQILRTGFAALALASIVACSTTTPYGPATDGQLGYVTQKLEDQKYRITFEGNSSTERSTLENYVLYRAAEITLEEGFDHFVLIDQSVESESKFRSDLDTYGPGFIGRRGFYYGTGYHNPTVRERKSYTAGAVFEARKGDKPANNENAYDARQIQQNLAAVIVRPS
jgi:hypothetical protein